MTPSMARRSGSVTTVEVPLEDWGFDFFRRGFFDTGICLVPIMPRRPADHRGSVPHVNRQRACPPFVCFMVPPAMWLEFGAARSPVT